jgi:uncharacterized protein
MTVARWTDHSFPPYSYVTGRFPHPLRDKDGHGCHGPAELTEQDRAPTNKDWSSCQAYLWGVDLFNAGFYWEAHEAWESVWHAAGRRGPVADLQKSLIKLAAAGVKAREGRINGVERHATRSIELANAIAAETKQPVFLGVNLQNLSLMGTTVQSQAAQIVEAANDIKAIVLPSLFLTQPVSNGGAGDVKTTQLL